MNTEMKIEMNKKNRILGALVLVSLFAYPGCSQRAGAAENTVSAVTSTASDSGAVASKVSEPTRFYATAYYVDDVVTEQLTVFADVVFRLTTRTGPAGGPCSMVSEGVMGSDGVVTVRKTILSNNRTCVYASDLVSYRLDSAAGELITEYGHIRLAR